MAKIVVIQDDIDPGPVEGIACPHPPAARRASGPSDKIRDGHAHLKVTAPFQCMVLTGTDPAALGGARAAGTLGVEVTDARLARALGLGNIDPQHGFGGGTGRAAIEAAIDWPLPAPDACLATLRADADALGAMAVLQLRALGVDLSPAIRSRIALIASHDCFENGDWSDWRDARGPLARPATYADVTAAPIAYRALTALAQGRSMGVDARVAGIRRWLATGALPVGACKAAWVRATALAEAWNRQSLTIETRADGRIALARGEAPGGLQLGYRFAPVVIAETRPEGARKVTIAQFSSGWVDLAGVRRRLDAREPGWGGSATILGSPLDDGSRLPLAEILVAVEEDVQAR